MSEELITQLLGAFIALIGAGIGVLNKVSINKSKKEQSELFNGSNALTTQQVATINAHVLNTTQQINIINYEITTMKDSISSLITTIEDIKRHGNKDKYINYVIESTSIELDRIIELKKKQIDDELETYLQTVLDTMNDMIKYIITADILYEDRQPFNCTIYKRKYNTLSLRRNKNIELEVSNKEWNSIHRIINNLQDSYILELQNIRKGKHGNNGERIEKFKDITIDLVRDTISRIIEEYSMEDEEELVSINNKNLK